MSDRFLECFLPGTGQRLATLREDVRRINIAHKNHHIVRSVLFVGERGTGKSQLAEIVAAHLVWLRRFPDGSGEEEWRAWPLKKLGAVAGMRRQTLTALPEGVAESILFGHKKGAFTDAKQDRDGAFKSDVDKDLLLDEVGDASMALQAKLLEVLETGYFRPVGSKWDDEAESTQVRVLAATNRSLLADVRAMRFRADLLDRLSTFVIYLPPLRETRDQIPVVVVRMMGDLATRFGLGKPPSLSPEDARFVTEEYDWPGNLRELEHGLIGWLVHERTRPLRTVVLQNAERLQPTGSATASSAEEALKAAIRSHLVAIANGLASPFETFGVFRKKYGDAGVEIVDELNRSGSAILRQAFTCSLASVQSQLSGWRKSTGAARRARRPRRA